MIKKPKNYLILIFLSIQVFLCIPILIFLFCSRDSITFSASSQINETGIIYPAEKRASPSYDVITGTDDLPHYRVLFWVPKTAKTFIPYADNGVKTDVSSHGPIENWSVVETQTNTDDEKLVFIFVPKTFVYSYGMGFEKIIHLKYN